MAFSRSWILGDDILGEEFCVSPQQVFVAVCAFRVGFELSFVAMVDGTSQSSGDSRAMASTLRASAGLLVTPAQAQTPSLPLEQVVRRRVVGKVEQADGCSHVCVWDDMNVYRRQKQQWLPNGAQVEVITSEPLEFWDNQQGNSVYPGGGEKVYHVYFCLVRVIATGAEGWVNCRNVTELDYEFDDSEPEEDQSHDTVTMSPSERFVDKSQAGGGGAAPSGQEMAPDEEGQKVSCEQASASE